MRVFSSLRCGLTDYLVSPTYSIETVSTVLMLGDLSSKSFQKAIILNCNISNTSEKSVDPTPTPEVTALLTIHYDIVTAAQSLFHAISICYLKNYKIDVVFSENFTSSRIRVLILFIPRIPRIKND